MQWYWNGNKGTTTIKAQKRSKDIVKVIHVTSGVQPSFFEEYFLCVKENKNNNFIQQFVSSTSPWRHFGEYHDVCFLLRTKSILVASKNYGWTPDVTWIILMMSLLYFWALIMVVPLLSMGGSESSQNSSKIS